MTGASTDIEVESRPFSVGGYAWAFAMATVSGAGMVARRLGNGPVVSPSSVSAAPFVEHRKEFETRTTAG